MALKTGMPINDFNRVLKNTHKYSMDFKKDLPNTIYSPITIDTIMLAKILKKYNTSTIKGLMTLPLVKGNNKYHVGDTYILDLNEKYNNTSIPGISVSSMDEHFKISVLTSREAQTIMENGTRKLIMEIRVSSTYLINKKTRQIDFHTWHIPRDLCNRRENCDVRNDLRNYTYYDEDGYTNEGDKEIKTWTLNDIIGCRKYFKN
jgi:hypothetical protein